MTAATSTNTLPYSWDRKELQKFLPQKQITDARFSLGNLEPYLDGKVIPVEKEVSNRFPLLTVLGVITLVGALFLSLAAHQILPHGVNALSNLGGRIAVYCTAAFAFALIVIGSVKTHLNKQHNTKIKGIEEENNRILCARNSFVTAVDERIDDFCREILQKNEVMMAADRNGPGHFIYYRGPGEGAAGSRPSSYNYLFGPISASKAFDEWKSKKPTERESSIFLTPEMIEVRIQEHEARVAQAQTREPQ